MSDSDSHKIYLASIERKGLATGNAICFVSSITLYGTEVVQYYRGQITGVDMGWCSTDLNI